MVYAAPLLPLWETERGYVTGPWFKKLAIESNELPCWTPFHTRVPNFLLKELGVTYRASLGDSWKLASGLLRTSLHETFLFEILLGVLSL